MQRIGKIDIAEPFASLFTQGMVTHETYQLPDTIRPITEQEWNSFWPDDPFDPNQTVTDVGPWLSPDEVERRGDRVFERTSGIEVRVGRVIKMSKSKKNVVDPDDIIAQYGADAVRWFMLSDSPPERDLPWSEAGIEGCARFVQRLWRLFDDYDGNATGENPDLVRKLHQTIAAVGSDIEALAFNKAVARIYEFTSAVEKAAPSATRSEAIAAVMLLIAPMMPHLAEEAWHRAGFEELVSLSAWPPFDPALLVDDEVTIAIQVKGKLRDTIQVAKGLPNEELEALALASEKVQRSIDGAPIRKVIVVPDRLVNIVA